MDFVVDYYAVVELMEHGKMIVVDYSSDVVLMECDRIDVEVHFYADVQLEDNCNVVVVIHYCADVQLLEHGNVGVTGYGADVLVEGHCSVVVH